MSTHFTPTYEAAMIAAGTPLTHARIGYSNILDTGTLTGTAGEVGFPLTAIQNRATYERYKPTASTFSIAVDAGAAVTVDYVGIASHTLGSSGSTILVESSSDGVTYTTQATISPSTDQSLLALFAAVLARYWRLSVTGAAVPVVGVVFIGESLVMQRALYGGHVPMTLARVTANRPNVSELGQFLGATQIRKGFKTSFSWKHLTAAWYRATFDPFVATNPSVAPFFIAWRPSSFPDEVGYCWATGDIHPTNAGGRDYMEVGMSVEAYNDR